MVMQDAALPNARVPPRQRLLAAATELFYRHGIRAVGVDAIAEAAGTNKMTLYRHFSSKDELVAEYCGKRPRRWMQPGPTSRSGTPAMRERSCGPGSKRLPRTSPLAASEAVRSPMQLSSCQRRIIPCGA